MSKFVDHNDMVFVEKSWGSERWLVNNEKFCGKILFMRKGEFFSFHYHVLKEELLYLSQGSVRFVLSQNKDGTDPVEKILLPGEGCYVTPGSPHQIEALEDSYIFEVSTQHFDSDSVRLSLSKGEGGSKVEISKS